MESSSLFDLNEAIRRWRERLIGLRSFGADDLEELENHLRESVSELQSGGLCLEEAFLVATERLGSDRQLAQEYAKTNTRSIWTGRALWMLGGVVASMAMAALARAGMSVSYRFGGWLGLDPRLVVTLDLLTQWTICAAGIGLGWWLVARRNRWLAGAVGKCLQRPVWTGAALLLALMGLQVLAVVVPHWLQLHDHPPAATLSPAGFATLRTWGFYAMALNRLVCIAAIPLLAAYLWKATRTQVASLPVLGLDNLQENERALADRLQAQGLSRSESHLVIAWRSGSRAAPAEAKPQFVSAFWLERGFWMVVGMVAYWMFRDFVERPSWILVHSDSSSPPLWQHLGGMIETCLPLTLFGAAIAAFWNGATGPQKPNGWLRRLFAQSPVRAAVWFATLAVLWVGLTSYLSLVHPPDTVSRIQSYGRIGLFWWMGKSLLTDYLLPAVLLVWVGNRYQAGRKSA